MSSYLLGLDIGGGGGRALLVDLHGRGHVAATRSWRFEPTAGSGGLGFDLDLASMWTQLGDATREVIARAGAAPGDILALAPTALRLGTVLLDRDGEVLFAVPNRDSRAAGPGIMLGIQHGESLYRRTGRWPYPIHAAARLQWLKREQSALFERIGCVLSIGDWLAWRLCGERATDPTQAAETLLFDITQGRWAPDIASELGLPSHFLPEVLAPGTRLGGLAPEAARHLGLTAGIAVAVGCGDTQAALLGAGVLEPGDAAAVAGTTCPIQMVVDRPVIDDEFRIWTSHHAIAGRFVLESNAGPMGEALSWIARLLFPEAPQPELRLSAEAGLSRVGSEGLLSSLGAEVMNARAMGLPVGHLTLSHLSSIDDASPRRHLARSVLEGMACAVRANLEQLEGVGGAAQGALRFTGGLSRSERLCESVAGVLARPLLRTREASASAVGAALCAGVAAGVFADLTSASRAHAELESVRAPRADEVDAYAALYTRWSQLRSVRAAADAEAATLTMPFALAQADSGGTRATADAAGLRILVTADFDEDSLGRLRRLGEVEYAPFRKMHRMLTGPGLVEAVRGFDVFITEIDLVDAASLKALPELRVVGTCRGDAVNVDIAACSAFGVPVLNAPGRNADAVADLAIAFCLMLARKLPAASAFLHQPDIAPGDMAAMGRAFGTLQGRELWHKTIGLIGLGAVGAKVAARLVGFGARVLVSDPFVDAERAALVGAELVDLRQLLAESDFVSLHAAVTAETEGLLGAEELACMKPDAFLVNTARAALVDEDALIQALRAGTIAGAALDTFSVEPPGSEHPFMSMDNVISTPHVGGNTVDVSAHQGEIMVADLERLLRGDRPRACLNPEAAEGFDFAQLRREPSAERLAELEGGPAPAVTDLAKKKKARGETETKPAVRAVEQSPTPEKAIPRDEVPAATLETMRAILARFVEEIVSDAAVRAFAQDRDVTLHFDLTDLGESFFFRLAPGAELSGGLGAPPAAADVALRMRAEMLDGMFTGKANPMEAAMDGRLSFTGDAAKAMTLQHMQADLERLYQVARTSVGDPGDLGALPEAGATPVPAPSRVAADDPRVRIVATVQELYEAQVITATGGNVSARAQAPNEVWITPSRLFKGDLGPEAMVRIDLDGRSLDSGARSPSSEWAMHCAIYRRRPEARAVIHAHAPHATVLANAGLPFLPISTEAAFFDDLPRVPFVMPGTGELAERVAEAMSEGWAALLVNHGLIVAGRSLRSAADMVEIIERTSEILLGCEAVGKKPPLLPEEVITTLRQMGELIA